MSETTRYIVTFKDGVTSDQIAAFRSGIGKNVLGGSNANVKELKASILGIQGFTADMTPDEVNQFKDIENSPIESIEVDSKVTTQLV